MTPSLGRAGREARPHRRASGFRMLGSKSATPRRRLGHGFRVWDITRSVIQGGRGLQWGSRVAQRLRLGLGQHLAVSPPKRSSGRVLLWAGSFMAGLGRFRLRRSMPRCAFSVRAVRSCGMWMPLKRCSPGPQLKRRESPSVEFGCGASGLPIRPRLRALAQPKRAGRRMLERRSPRVPGFQSSTCPLGKKGAWCLVGWLAVARLGQARPTQGKGCPCL
mmetsp:Transcript_75621/g.209315  ORF Transcript_75621/g.209315 Transcript_75621/m.209315 type:complete len:219 (+) Transcript_75621:461-1117(+)